MSSLSTDTSPSLIGTSPAIQALDADIAAVVTFVANGKVLFILGVPAAVAGIAGNLLGARLVIRRGAAVVRPVFIFTLLLLFAKVLYDLLAAR